jgi:GntR family transcriptional regulator
VEAAVEAAGAKPGRRIVAFGFVDAPAAVAGALRLPPADAEVLRVERVNLADDEPFALVTVWVRSDIGADVSRADVARTPFYDLLPIRGVELESVHQSITAEIADADAADLLACSPGDPLLLVRRTTSDMSGAPILYSEHRYPADRTTFEIEFSLATGARQHA